MNRIFHRGLTKAMLAACLAGGLTIAGCSKQEAAPAESDVATSDTAIADHAAPMSEIEEAAIRLACENVSKEYAYYLDTADYEGMPNAFADDGVWEVLGNKMEGHDAIRDYWKSRTALWKENDGWLHLISNQRIDVIDRDNARGVAYFSVYKFDVQQGANESLSPLVFSKSTDEYVRTPEGWKIKRRSIERVADAVH